MNREDFLRKLRKYARKKDLSFDLQKDRGKGAHYRVRLGEKVATVQSGELSPFNIRRLCEQLGIDPAEL